MRHEWYIEKWDGDRYIGRTPNAMTKYEADMLAKAVSTMVGNERFAFKVVHQSAQKPKNYADQFRQAFRSSGQATVRHKRSGKIYFLENAVYEANTHEPRPYVYVWPVAGRRRNRPVWCYLESLEVLAQM